jgi:hypothetical protein
MIGLRRERETIVRSRRLLKHGGRPLKLTVRLLHDTSTARHARDS